MRCCRAEGPPVRQGRNEHLVRRPLLAVHVVEADELVAGDHLARLEPVDGVQPVCPPPGAGADVVPEPGHRGPRSRRRRHAARLGDVSGCLQRRQRAPSRCSVGAVAPTSAEGAEGRVRSTGGVRRCRRGGLRVMRSSAPAFLRSGDGAQQEAGSVARRRVPADFSTVYRVNEPRRERGGTAPPRGPERRCHGSAQRGRGSARSGAEGRCGSGRSLDHRGCSVTLVMLCWLCRLQHSGWRPSLAEETPCHP